MREGATKGEKTRDEASPGRYGVAVIGMGTGRLHLEACLRNPRTEPVVVCDVDDMVLRGISDEYDGIRVTTRLDDVLNDPRVDITIIATPDHEHCAQTIAALKAGKHVLCEKPMARTLAECRRMLETAQAGSQLLMIGHSARFSPVWQAARKLIDDGLLGQIYCVQTEYAHDYSAMLAEANWRFDPALARHVFLGGGCHAVDLARWFIDDEVTEVAAMANHFSLPGSSLDDCVSATYRGASDQIATVFVSSGCKRPYTMGATLYGTAGTLIATNVETTARLWVEAIPGLGREWLTVPTTVDVHPMTAQLAHFVESIDQGAPPMIDGHEGMKTVAASLAAIAATEQRNGVPIRTDVP